MINKHLSGKNVVLVGGGHSQIEVLRQFGMSPPSNAQLTLISNAYHAPYSGMLPGFIAGHYDYHDIHIDLRPLTKFAGCRVLQDAVEGVDLEKREVHCANRPPVPFDILSLNIGSTPGMDDVPGARQFAVPVKPVDKFLKSWEGLQERVRKSEECFRFVLIGGGAGGVELALSIHNKLTSDPKIPANVSIQLVTATPEILMTHNQSVRKRASRHLRESDIALATNEEISQVALSEVICESGAIFPYDALLWVTQASPAPWLASSGIATDPQGFILVDETLRSTSHPFVFAAGDIATMAQSPRPKSGVFAVRQGPYLARNLRRMLEGESLQKFTPQRRFLSLIGTGKKCAIASKGPWAAEGSLIWRWKDQIDRKFMDKYANLPAMAMDEEATSGNPTPDTIHCAGCGSKVGSSILHRVLDNLKSSERDGVCIGLEAPDDAAVIEVPPGKLSVHSVDFFRSFLDDPYLLGGITVNHCLSDLHAMGATPHSAMALVTLPYGEAAHQERMLQDLLSGTLEALTNEGASLVGGHTTEGPELSFGLTVNGYIDRDAILRKSGMSVGEVLILTKPLGTGLLLAADMRGKARGQWLEEATTMMLKSNATAAACLREHGATACTDVTGFGLAGHLIEMCQASKLSASLSMDTLPVLPGVVEVLATDIRSSLYPQNAELGSQIAPDNKSHTLFPILFDPQTAGGLLATVREEDAQNCLNSLHAAGFEQARVIGTVESVHPESCLRLL